MVLAIAEILDRNTESIIQLWYNLLQREEDMTSVPMAMLVDGSRMLEVSIETQAHSYLRYMIAGGIEWPMLGLTSRI